MDYTVLKAVHVGSAVLSITGFAARGVLMLRQSPLLASRFARVAPHIVDTVLLASAVWLAWLTHQYPVAQPWLTAKLVALVAYIVPALSHWKRGHTRAVPPLCACSPWLPLYIVSVALTRQPSGPLALFN